MIRSVMSEDAPAICDIYNHHVENTIVTFEEQPVRVTEMRERIRKIVDEYPWLVLQQEGRVLGYAYADRWKSRSAYRYSVESTIYLAEEATGRGLGTKLYKALLAELKLQPLHIVLAGIALPNPASVALHERLGFQKVAHLKDVGRKFNQWIDVGYWELVLADNAATQNPFI